MILWNTVRSLVRRVFPWLVMQMISDYSIDKSIDSHSFVTLYRYTHEHTHISAVKFWTWIKLSPLPVHTFENILVKGHQPVGKGWWNGACFSTKLWKTRDIKRQGFPLHTSQISYYLLNSSLELAYYMQSLDWATIFFSHYNLLFWYA